MHNKLRAHVDQGGGWGGVHQTQGNLDVNTTERVKTWNCRKLPQISVEEGLESFTRPTS